MKFGQGFEQTAPVVEPPAPRQIDPNHAAFAEQFLGDAGRYVSEEEVQTILKEATTRKEKETAVAETTAAVSYDRYKKTFLLGNTPVTKGQLVASRHLGASFMLPDALDDSFDGKKLRALCAQKNDEDFIFTSLNKLLAEALAKETERKDALKATAYAAIAARSQEGDMQHEQLGVLAEHIVHGVAEMIAIDRPDLGITVHAANAYQDVEEKIDFIITTKQKRRGAGIESKELPPEEKHVGIQFTINTAKESFKKEQIAKAKERGVDVDDIVYVAIDSTVLKNALRQWEQGGKAITGPWAHMPTEAKRKLLFALFHSVLTEEQENSLLKHI